MFVTTTKGKVVEVVRQVANGPLGTVYFDREGQGYRPLMSANQVVPIDGTEPLSPEAKALVDEAAEDERHQAEVEAFRLAEARDKAAADDSGVVYATVGSVDDMLAEGSPEETPGDDGAVEADVESAADGEDEAA
jgi:hypothetical protein